VYQYSFFSPSRVRASFWPRPSMIVLRYLMIVLSVPSDFCSSAEPVRVPLPAMVATPTLGLALVYDRSVLTQRPISAPFFSSVLPTTKPMGTLCLTAASVSQRRTMVLRPSSVGVGVSHTPQARSLLSGSSKARGRPIWPEFLSLLRRHSLAIHMAP